MEDSRRLSELLLEQSPSCQWMVSADGVFQRVHGDAAPVFGKPAAELTGRPFSQILDRQIADSWSERFARAFEGKSMTLRQRHCDGIWNITVFPIRVEGEIRYAGGLAREGTPWNSAEWELRRIVLSALKTQESERFRTARFLHDTIGQDLTALGFQLDLVRLDL